MSSGWWRWGCCLALLPGLKAPALAQLPEPPPLPAVPVSPELANCVTRYGPTGCAARLYAQLLCRSVGDPAISEQLEQQLAEQYEQAAIDFRGITPEQVETAAVRYYSPMLCPEKSPQIRQLFNPS